MTQVRIKRGVSLLLAMLFLCLGCFGVFGAEGSTTENGQGTSQTGTGNEQGTQTGTGNEQGTSTGTGDNQGTPTGTGDNQGTSTGTGDNQGTQTGTGDNQGTQTEDPCKNGHDFSAWEMREEATCKTGKIEIRKCKNCDKEEARVGEALGHDYKLDEASKVAPTCEKEGYSLSICTRCKDEVITHPAALGHADANNDNKCDRCGAQIQDSAHAQEPEEEELNFFQRIIQWFRNLFAGLFG